MKTEIEVTQQQVNDFMSSFCPFGLLDCRTAIQTAIEAGFNVDWVVDQIEQFCDETGVKLNDVDPCYCVYESILQLARNEISDKANYDFLNDAENGEICTYGNFMCTDYDYPEAAIQELIEALANADIDIEDFQESTQYFLSQIGISQDEINAIISKNLNAETE